MKKGGSSGVRTEGEDSRARARGGGYLGPDGFVFELCGGCLCLDFVNTLDERRQPSPKERLRTYADLVDWSVQAGAIGSGERKGLLDRARRSPGRARATLGKAHRFREALFATFSCVISGRPAPSGARKQLDLALQEAFARPVLLPMGSGYQLRWQTDPVALSRMLQPVVRSAAELLSSEELSRVRVCASDTCAWLFLDETRNKSRKWCDMTVCGNRAKARRFYRRQKK